MTAKVESKPVSWLKPDPNQPRKAFDEDQLRLLGASLLKKQWYALLVLPSGMILDGERRWRAAKLVGKETLEVIVLNGSVSQDDAKELQLVTALHHAELSPFEQACGFRDWLAQNSGIAKTAKELATRIDRDQSLITKYLSVFDCIEPVQVAAAAAKIGPSQWYPISLTPPDQQGELLEMHLAGVPRDQLAEACRRNRTKAATKPSALPQPKLARVRCPLASGSTVVVSGPDMSLQDLIETLQSALQAARKAIKDQLDIRTFERVLKDKAKGVGHGRASS